MWAVAIPGYHVGMILRQNGTRLSATLTSLDGKPALLLAGQAIVLLGDPILGSYECAHATADEVRALKKAGWPFRSPLHPSATDDDPL